jgi:hypothetical protein
MPRISPLDVSTNLHIDQCQAGSQLFTLKLESFYNPLNKTPHLRTRIDSK